MDEIEKKRKNPLIDLVRAGLGSNVYPFATAALSLLCYYLGWDMVFIYYLAASVLLMLFLLDDLTPLVSCFLFMSVIVSVKNSPSSTVGGSDFYMRTHNLAQIIAVLTLIVAAVAFRTARNIKLKQIKITPVFIGLCVFSVFLVTNGIFAAEYNPMNIVYGIFMAFFFLGIYTLISSNVDYGEETLKRISYGFAALGLLLVVELAVKYITTDEMFIDGDFSREFLMFGWGVYNTMGMLIVVSIPPVVYLAAKEKHGYIFYVLALILFVASYFTTSRQAMVVTTFVFPACFVFLMIKGKNRAINLAITAGALLVAVVFIIAFRKPLFDFLKPLFESLFKDGKPNGSGRWELWLTAIDNFKSAPLFGTGFYVPLPPSLDTVGLDIIPLMYHNTFMQLLGSCGIAGFAAYAAHRVQTVICFCKKPTFDRIFIALTIGALLLLNLFDNHLFYILPTMIYSSFVALLVKSNK